MNYTKSFHSIITLFLSFFLLASYDLFALPKEKVILDVSLSNPVLEANRTQTTYLKVGLTGFTLANSDRVPVNISLVLDKSGSMGGDKIARAKEAAVMMVNMLEKNDIFSLVVYDSNVKTIIPATKLSDKTSLLRKINRISSGGSTALFGGVSKGIAEVEKFFKKDIVNRVVLLSDGLANVGPSTPYELGRLGIASAKKGIAITTIGLGLGYNEDLMTQLAMNSDGNHAFVENARDLAGIFSKELGDVFTVVAQDVKIIITCPEGMRPTRVIDRNATIRDREVTLFLNQIYSKQQKYVILELEVPAEKAGKKRKVASVDIVYNNMKTRVKDNLQKFAMASFSASREKVKENANVEVQVKATRAIANETNKKAIVLRDKGDIKGAQGLMTSNSEMLRQQAEILNSDTLLQESREVLEDARVIDDEEQWNKNRKIMRKKQYKETNQTSY